jgi:hypothetical protein
MNKLKNFTIVDCNHTDSHNMFNSQLIKKLAEVGSVMIFSWNKSYDYLSEDNVIIKKPFYIKTKSQNSFIARLILFINTSLNAIYLNYFNSRSKSISIIIGYEIISLSICSFFFPRKSYLIHHMQVDELKNSIKNFFFLILKLNFYHVVMTDYIKEFLISKINLNEKKIRVIPHPIYKIKKYSGLEIENYRTFVSLSYSNNELLVNRLIDEEKANNLFENNNCKLFIKSKIYNYTSPGLNVFNKYLDEVEYYNLYNKSVCVLSILDDSFEYRISGTLIDAISAKKHIITLSTRCAEYYKKMFPLNITICDNIDDMISTIIKFNSNINPQQSSNNLISHYNKIYSDSVKKSFY